jgi:hypothetical protein
VSLTIFDPAQQPEAVVLDLVQPVIAGWRRGHEHAELRRDRRAH